MTWIQSAVEWLFGASLFVNAMLFVPQIYRLWQRKHSRDVSLMTFGGFCVMQTIAVVHGYFTHDLVLAWGFGVSLLACGCVTILAVYYRVVARG